MGLGDFANKAKDAASNNEQVQQAGEQGLNKAADTANNMTGDKFSDQVGQGRDAASDALGFGDQGGQQGGQGGQQGNQGGQQGGQGNQGGQQGGQGGQQGGQGGQGGQQGNQGNQGNPQGGNQGGQSRNN